MMTETNRTLSKEYFDKLYDSSRDPWHFETSDYEREKYRETLQALPDPRYRSAFEVGCSIGVLTALLAARCDRLLSVDISTKALETAKARCANLPQVSFAQMEVPKDWPTAQFDLILLSEMVYYLDDLDVNRLAERVRRSLIPGGDCVLVHWTKPTEYPQTGDGAATLFIKAMGNTIKVLNQRRFESYRIDVLKRVR